MRLFTPCTCTMAAAASGSVVGREGSEDVIDRKMWQGNEEMPQEGTKKHMEVVEVRRFSGIPLVKTAHAVVPPIQRYLDELSFCGTTINDLELQLSSTRAAYRRTLAECKVQLEETRRRLGASIPRSQPFIDVWRRARQVRRWPRYTLCDWPRLPCVRSKRSPTRRPPGLTRPVVSTLLPRK